MTDHEYAVCIYAHVYNRSTDTAVRDANVGWILDAISNKLSAEEQFALESRYRRGKTYKQIGDDMGGLSNEQASRFAKKALMKLRRKSVARNMSIANIIEDRDTYKQGLEDTKKRLENADKRPDAANKPDAPLLQGLSSNEQSVAVIDMLEMRVFNMNLPTHAVNAFIYADRPTLGSVLELKTYGELMKIRNIGQKSAALVIAAMRELGFRDWADNMEAGRRRQLQY